MTPPIYEIDSLHHSYTGRPVLTVEHLTVEPASIVGLIGPNGSGKSTLLNVLGLIEKPVRGEIRFAGRRVEPFAEDARFLITLLPQEPFLMKRSVFSNVAYGLRLKGCRGPEIAERVDEALQLVGLDGRDFGRRPWYALSGGEAQRVALAARLALNPKILLLDEPTASVDAASIQRIKEAVMHARQELGTTLIVASHDWQWLYEICDEILHLIRGRIFPAGRETVVFGPWRETGKGKWAKLLSDGQRLYVPPPPETDSAAVLQGVSLSRNGTAAADGEVVLKGIVTRLSLERKSGRVFANILAGDLSITLGVTPDQSRNPPLYPGEDICLRYPPDRIRWI